MHDVGTNRPNDVRYGRVLRGRSRTHQLEGDFGRVRVESHPVRTDVLHEIAVHNFIARLEPPVQSGVRRGNRRLVQTGRLFAHSGQIGPRAVGLTFDRFGLGLAQAKSESVVASVSRIRKEQIESIEAKHNWAEMCHVDSPHLSAKF